MLELTPTLERTMSRYVDPIRNFFGTGEAYSSMLADARSANWERFTHLDGAYCIDAPEMLYAGSSIGFDSRTSGFAVLSTTTRRGEQ